MVLAILSALAEFARLAAIWMSRHMKILKHVGLVVYSRDAQWVRHRLNPDLTEEVTA